MNGVRSFFIIPIDCYSIFHFPSFSAPTFRNINVLSLIENRRSRNGEAPAPAKSTEAAAVDDSSARWRRSRADGDVNIVIRSVAACARAANCEARPPTSQCARASPGPCQRDKQVFLMIDERLFFFSLRVVFSRTLTALKQVGVPDVSKNMC